MGWGEGEARHKRMRARAGAVWALLGGGLLLGVVSSASAEAEDPAITAARATVRTALDEVIAVLDHEDWSSEKRVHEIEQIAYRYFDFATMSRLVLARNYKKFSEAQRAEFEMEFKNYLSRNYGDRIDQYEQQKVEITGARLEKRGDVTVISKIVGGKANGFKWDFRLRERGAAWKMIDVVLEGVSLIANFRAQFKDVVNKNGPEGLLEALRDKNNVFETPS